MTTQIPKQERCIWSDKKTTNELLLEGCIAALAAFEDRTKSPIRIRANIRFLKKVISQATGVQIK